MMKGLILAGFAMLITSPAIACAGVGCEGRLRAIHNVVSCLKSNAARLDDGISDAMTIGVAVRSACQDKEEQLLAADEAAQIGKRDYDFELGYRSKNEPFYLELAVRALLDHRRGPR